MKYWLEIIAIVAITAFAAMFLVQNAQLQNSTGPAKEAFPGTDDIASGIIEDTGYHPWVSPLWVPPGNGVESLIFTLSAATGALIIGYFFGYQKGRKDREQPKEPNGR
jgi:cobalt/nickel transport protein